MVLIKLCTGQQVHNRGNDASGPGTPCLASRTHDCLNHNMHRSHLPRHCLARPRRLHMPLRRTDPVPLAISTTMASEEVPPPSARRLACGPYFYSLDASLGRGTFAEVFKGWDAEVGHTHSTPRPRPPSTIPPFTCESHSLPLNSISSSLPFPFLR